MGIQLEEMRQQHQPSAHKMVQTDSGILLEEVLTLSNSSLDFQEEQMVTGHMAWGKKPKLQLYS